MIKKLFRNIILSIILGITIGIIVSFVYERILELKLVEKSNSLSFVIKTKQIKLNTIAEIIKLNEQVNEEFKQKEENKLLEQIPKEEKQENAKTNNITEIIIEKPKESNTKNSNKVETNNSKQPESNKTTNPEQSTEQTTSTVKAPTKWEQLGISEYDYYNSPMWKWQKIDFKVNDYGSREATEKACKEYGNAYNENNAATYWCHNVTSYSGNYLGEYIDIKMLKESE